MMKKSAAATTGGGALSQTTIKGRSEEQIHTAKFPADLVKKALSEKSQSQSAIRVGPFAAIREAESEKRRQKNGSLDIDEAMFVEEELDNSNSNNGNGGSRGERASTIGAKPTPAAGGSRNGGGHK